MPTRTPSRFIVVSALSAMLDACISKAVRDVSGESRDAKGRWARGASSYFNFRSWFGDFENDPVHSSKVVEPDGMGGKQPQKNHAVHPTVVFHGTRGNFRAFSERKLGGSTGHPTANLGYFFTASARIAYEFGGGVLEKDRPKSLDEISQEVSGKPFAEGDWGEQNAASAAHLIQPGHVNLGNAPRSTRILPAYLNIRHPYEMTSEDFTNLFDADIGTFKKKIVGQGYDGLHFKADEYQEKERLGETFGYFPEFSAETWVAFHPNQIKSVANIGEWNPLDNDIYKAVSKDNPSPLPGGPEPLSRASVAAQRLSTRLCRHPAEQPISLHSKSGGRIPAKQCAVCGRIKVNDPKDHADTCAEGPEEGQALSPCDNAGNGGLSKAVLPDFLIITGILLEKGHDVSGQPRKSGGQHGGGQFVPERADGIYAEARSLYESGLSKRNVAAKMGLPYGSMTHIFAKSGVKARSKSEANMVHDPEVEAKVLRYALDGKRWDDIAKDLGVSKTRARRVLRDLGVEKPAALKGISQAYRDEAVRLYTDEKMSTPEIARRLNISEPTASHYVGAAGVIRSPSERSALGVQKRRDTGQRVGPQGISAPWYSEKTGMWGFADSSYEVVRMSQLDNDPDVKTWKRNAPTVIYNTDKRYVPDFLIEMTDGKKIVEEVKPRWLLHDKKVQAKAEAARKFFGAQGIDYRIVTEREIGIDALRDFDYDGLPFINDITRAKLKRAAFQTRVARWQEKQEALSEGNDLSEGEPIEKSVSSNCFSNPSACQLRWITAHPHDQGGKGVALLVHDNGEEYTVVGGAGGSMNQTVFRHKAGSKEDAAARKTLRSQGREARKKEALSKLGEGGQVLQKHDADLKDAIGKQTEDVQNRILSKLGDGMGQNAIQQVMDAARAKAKEQNPDATPQQQSEFAEKAAKAARQDAVRAAKDLTARALDHAAIRKLGDADTTPAQFEANIGGQKLLRNFSPEELDGFVRDMADIAQKKGVRRAIARALVGGDQNAMQGIDTDITPLSQEEADSQNLSKYLDKQSVNDNAALVMETEKSPTSSQRTSQAAGAADSINALSHEMSGQAILHPGAIAQMGVENAARVAAAFLTKRGAGKQDGDAIHARIAAGEAASVHSLVTSTGAMDAIVQSAQEAAKAGGGDVTQAQASIMAANMAKRKYVLLNTGRGGLRAAAAVANFLGEPGKDDMRLPGGDSRTAAENTAKGYGLAPEDYTLEENHKGKGNGVQGGGYSLVIPAGSLDKLATPHSLADSDRSSALDALKEDVQENGGHYSPPGMNPDFHLRPHQELAARAIVEQKHMVLNYGAGSGKTGTLLAATADLLSSGKIDRALYSMPKQPKSGLTADGGDLEKAVTPEFAGQVAVINDPSTLAHALEQIKSGEKKVLVVSPDTLRNHAKEIEAAGFGGPRSLFAADEAHEFATRDTNAQSGRTGAAQTFAKSGYAVAMSGTLVKNDASELASVFDLIHPGQLGDKKQFAKEWGRLAQGQSDLFAGEAMRGMRDRLGSGMLSYSRPVSGKDGEPLTLTDSTVTVDPTPAQKAEIADINTTYRKEKASPNVGVAKAAALRRDARTRRVLNTGKDNPKLAALQAIMDSEKKRDPKNRVGVYSFEKGPLRDAQAALAGSKLQSVTGDNQGSQTRDAINAVNDRKNDTDGLLLSNAGVYGINAQGLDNIVKLGPMDTPANEEQLNHRHYRTGQTRDVRTTSIISSHPSEALAQFRTRNVKLPQVTLLAALADDSGQAGLLSRHLNTIKEAAGVN